MEDSRKRLENLEQDKEEILKFIESSQRANVKLHLLDYQNSLTHEISELKKKIETLEKKQETPLEVKQQKEKQIEYVTITKYLFENNKDNVK